LCEKLIVPRLETPRLTVPPGSIGIADRLTGVYSVESPGGWRIIGRTPLKIFDFNRENPMPIKPGDIVSFKSISIEEYYELRDVFISDYHG
ncbi:MAG: carboxyltransferase domain-containing protein, partial [Desulfurococcaceae archaeon]